MKNKKRIKKLERRLDKSETATHKITEELEHQLLKTNERCVRLETRCKDIEDRLEELIQEHRADQTPDTHDPDGKSIYLDSDTIKHLLDGGVHSTGDGYRVTYIP